MYICYFCIHSTRYAAYNVYTIYALIRSHMYTQYIYSIHTPLSYLYTYTMLVPRAAHPLPRSHEQSTNSISK